MTEVSPQHGSANLGVKDRESLRTGYNKIIYGLIGFIVAMILLVPVLLLSVEYIIENRRDNYVKYIPFIAFLYSMTSLARGSLKLKKPLYLMPIALTGIGFLLFSGVLMLLLINPLLASEESLLLIIMWSPKIGALGLALLFLFMRRDLVDQHKTLALIASIIAFIGVADYTYITAIIASIVMIYNLHSLRKRL